MSRPKKRLSYVTIQKPKPEKDRYLPTIPSTMKLLLDEMYTGLKDHLTVLGWEVETVRDAGITGKQDREIAEHAKRHGLLLVT